MAKNQFNPDYPATIDEAIENIMGQMNDFKNVNRNYFKGICYGLNISLTVLTQLKKNMKKERK